MNDSITVADHFLRAYILRLNNREKQFYGTLCLAKYCTVSKISHPDITKLLFHLLSIMVSTNLPKWECDGASLPINGRGDPLSRDICQILGPTELQDFRELIDATIEIGLADMYGVPTDQPTNFLIKCLNKLASKAVVPPEMIEFPRHANLTSKWGNAITENEYKSLLRQAKNYLPN